MVHFEVYLNKYVVNPHSENCSFCMFSLFIFFIHLSRGSADPICPYVRTPMSVYAAFPPIVACRETARVVTALITGSIR